MHPWKDPRRYQAALHQQEQINEEAAARARVESAKPCGVGYLLFILAVLFFKPIAEYFIDLYNTLAGYAHSLGALLGSDKRGLGMKKVVSTMLALGLLIPGAVWAQSKSSILPVLIGAYAPAEGGCEAAAAAFIYVEDKAIGANKTAGKVLSVKQDGSAYSLDVLWIEAGSRKEDGDRDTVTIEVRDDRAFIFSNTVSKRTLMRWCS